MAFCGAVAASSGYDTTPYVLLVALIRFSTSPSLHLVPPSQLVSMFVLLVLIDKCHKVCMNSDMIEQTTAAFPEEKQTWI